MTTRTSNPKSWLFLALVAIGLVGVPTLAASQPPAFQWAVRMGQSISNADIKVEESTVDAAENVYTVGRFTGTVDFDPGPGTFYLATTSATDPDIWVQKLDNAGNFVWAVKIGSSGFDTPGDMAQDAAGNLYISGNFNGTVDFDPGPGTFNLTGVGSNGRSSFVLKLDSGGNLVWAAPMGGNGAGFNNSLGIALDASGNVHHTGEFSGTGDFDPGPGVFNLTSTGGPSDIYVQKLDNTGNFVWAVAFAGNSRAVAFDVAVDGSGNVYSTGTFPGTLDFDPGPGTSNLTSAGGGDIYVSKLDGGGNFVWAVRMGSTGADAGQGIAADGSGNVYTAGRFTGTVDFDPGSGTSNLSSSSHRYFLQKLDSGGNFAWAIHGGSEVELDGSGNLFTFGEFAGTVDFDPGPGALNLTSAGNADAFVQKLDSGANVDWALAMGGSANDSASGVALGGSGNVYLCGSFQDTADFDPGPGTFNLTSSGGRNTFVVKLGAAVTDSDGDGVADGDDLCPGTAAGGAVDADGCSDAQVDADGDGYCAPGAPSGGPSGCTGTDCDDADASINPGETEVCDGVDNDCSGAADDGIAPVPTTCGLGQCAGNTGAITCVGGVLVDSCDPFDGATSEVCDGADNDCDGTTDEDIAPVPTTCGLGECAGNAGEATCEGGVLVDSCDPFDGAVEEICDALDNDCDGDVDEGFDADGDEIADCFDDCPFDADNDLDGDEVCGDLDVCEATVIPEGVPTQRLGVNRFALTDGDTEFDTKSPPGNGGGPGLAFTTGDTAGCSCEQIIEALELGNGHVKFGCSISAMEAWVALVNP